MDVFYQKFKKEIISMLYKFFQKTVAEGTLFNSFIEANITPIIKSNKGTTWEENYTSILLIKINGKIFVKRLVNLINNIGRSIIYNKSYIP